MSLSRFVALLFLLLPISLIAKEGCTYLDVSPKEIFITTTPPTACSDHSNPSSCTCVPHVDECPDLIIQDGASFVIDLIKGKNAENYFWEIEMNNVLGAEAGGGKIIEQSLCIIDNRFEAFVDYEIFPRNKLCVGKPIMVRVYVKQLDEELKPMEKNSNYLIANQ